MKKKVNIATSHRFHLLDLARELDKQGFDVRFYSYVPTKRCVKYGFKKDKCICLLPYVAFTFALQKLFPQSEWIVELRFKILDFIMSHFMRQCDVYIALGTVYKDSLDAAKRRFGAKTILEWGSKHVDAQQKILASIGAKLNKESANVRSREGYEKADYIAIATDHVERSFLERGFPQSKFLKNPYGVDLSDFYPINNVEKKYDLIMVGNWGLQKGCDLITEAVRLTGCTFLHVGSVIGDVPFPDEPNFTHHDKVDQKELVKFYNQAKVMAFPSRQEGLAMVQAQAIACNLPLVGSHDSGAEDLKRMVELPEYITIIEEHTPEAVATGIKTALTNFNKLDGKVYAGEAIGNLTWDAYGKRYASFLERLNMLNTGGVKIKVLYFKYDLIMVGGWCYRKGCDLIVDAVKQVGCSLLHVGGVVDMPFPEDENFTHYDAVDQKSLVSFYNQAKVFILPSREEGLAMVQAQAAACNLPIIGSHNSGAEDLKRMVENPEYITIIKEYTVEAVTQTIQVALALNESKSDKRYIGNAEEALSWEAYGKRYADFINEAIK